MKDRDDWDEAFRYQERKEQRKERRHARTKDQSQFKKTDLDQKRKRQAEVEAPIEGLKEGRVLAILPETILVASQGCEYNCTLKGALKQQTLRMKNLVAVGDFVFFTEDNVIEHVKERKSILSRADNLSRQKQQLIAVNIDQVLITCSIVFPPLKPALIDRYIIAAQKGNMRPILVINKIDLIEEQMRPFFDEFVQTYRSLGIGVFPVSTTTNEGIDALKNEMQGKASVISGQSGVGKTSLINAIMGYNLPTGEVIEQTMKGSHTTTSARLLPMIGGGFCIDTPGIRSFGMWDLQKDEIESYFPEIFEIGLNCKYPDCRHIQEPGCAVKLALEEGRISPLRFDSYCALMQELASKHKPR